MTIDVQREWQEYRKACFGGRPLSQTQEVELHRAFFSGMLVALNTMLNLAEEDDEDVAGRQLKQLHDQVLGQIALRLEVN